jgi:transposase
MEPTNTSEATKNEAYHTSLRDAEWAVIEKHLTARGKVGRPPRFERRAVIDAIFYMVRTGGAWRLLPHDLPPWRIVYYYYAKWRAEGLWLRLHDALREAARAARGKKSPERRDIGQPERADNSARRRARL